MGAKTRAKSKPKAKCKFCHRMVSEKAGRWGTKQAARHYCPHGERCHGGESPGYYDDPRRSGSCKECMAARQAEQTVAKVHRMHSKTYGPVRLQAEHVRCGKASCKRCQQGLGHGPYWRGYATPRSLGSRTADMMAGNRSGRVVVYLGSSTEPPSIAEVDRRIAEKLAGKPKTRAKTRPKA